MENSDKENNRGESAVIENNSNTAPLIQKQTSWVSLILSGIIRIIGGLAGLFILWGLYDFIFIQGKTPIWSYREAGYYGPVMLPLSLFLALSLIGYAIGGQKFLRKFAPGMAEKHNNAANPDLKEVHRDDDALKK